MSDQTPLSAEQAGQLARIAQHEKSAIDPLCVCGHRASTHDATADSGDTRCLAVEAREDLISAFDDGRDGAYGYCACLRFTGAQPSARRGS